MRYSERHEPRHADHDDTALHHVIVHCDTLAEGGLMVEQQHGHRSANEIECVHLTPKEIAERERVGAEAFAAQATAEREAAERAALIRERAATDPAFAALAGALGLDVRSRDSGAST